MTKHAAAYLASIALWGAFAGGVLYLKQPAPAPAPEPAEIPPLVIEEAPIEEPEIEVKAVENVYDPVREDIPLDAETQRLLYPACLKTGIRYELALAVIWQETDFRNIMGDGGESFGYLQVQPRWHSERMERLGVSDLLDPYGNFLVGCDYLAELVGKYDTEEALTAYNSGKPGNSEYAQSVLNYMKILTTEDF